MSDYISRNISPAEEIELFHGFYIALINAEKSPPHIAILIEGNVFSIGVNGSKVGEPLTSILKLIRIKQIPTLFFKLEIPKFYSSMEVLSLARDIFSSQSPVGMNGVTCLTPVKMLCKEVFNIEVENVQFIFELMPELDRFLLVEHCYELNMGPYLTNNAYTLRTYSIEDIFNHVDRLKETPVV